MNTMNTEEIMDQPLYERRARVVYLITYSRADMTIFPTKGEFATSVVEIFNEGKVKVESWVCCLESHKVEGVHYHLAVKLTRPRRWKAIKMKIQEKYGISVHFSSRHDQYFDAWFYVTKHDREYTESDNHPDFKTCVPPRTAAATRKRKSKVNQKVAPNERQRPAKKQKKLTNFDVTEIILAKNIHTRTELLALSQEQKTKGNNHLAVFVLNRGAKNINELIDTAWEMKGAKQETERNKKSRKEIIQSFLSKDCVPGCNGDWLSAAKEVLSGNDIERSDFGTAVLTLLEKGRGKYRNVMIVGPANCGKTFILQPLCVMYKCFLNPASTTFAWVGAETAEVILLNDFRWSKQIIPWHDLLQMLEGQPVHLSAPKTHYAKDLVLDKDTPIFCTSSTRIRYVSQGAINERETEMMEVRWKVFSFYKQIPEGRQREITPCGTCFAHLILDD